jgi:uncharacterized protein (DUF58 family)
MPKALKGLILSRDGIEACLTVEDRTKLGRNVLLSRYVVEGNLAGAHRSPLRGLSSEFADHKAYGLGDDPKNLDWRVLARTDKYYVKRFQDETNLRVYLVVDGSGSMCYGSGSTTKFAYALRLAAGIGYVVVKARDSVGMFLQGDKVDIRLPARNSMQHLNDLLRQAIRNPPKTGRGGSLAQALHRVATSVRKRALVVVLSDLLEDEEETRSALARLRKHHHDVIVLQIMDPTELDLEVGKQSLFVDMETGERLPISAKDIRPAYLKAIGEFLASYQRHCAALAIDYRLVRTDEPVGMFMNAWLMQRRRFSL